MLHAIVCIVTECIYMKTRTKFKIKIIIICIIIQILTLFEKENKKKVTNNE